MTSASRRHYQSKIHPHQSVSQETLSSMQLVDQTRIGLGPGDLALREWQAQQLELPDFDVIMPYRVERIRQTLRQFDYAGIILSDPLNIRYATDSSNMQVWTMHNNARYCFIATEGPIVLFDFKRVEHLTEHLAWVDEVRPARMWMYHATGKRSAQFAREWAVELAELVRTHGSGNRRLAIDRVNPEGLWELERQGMAIQDGEEIMELSRVIKHPEEIKAIRCAVAACESSIRVMQQNLAPGMSEQDLWSHLHAEIIKRGGEWLETRLLASGPRTNPWYHECSSRLIQSGDIVAFDTDLIGPYGYCVDMSRTWLCGDVKPTDEQRTLYHLAYDQLKYNQALLKPGLTFREVSERAKSLPPDYLPNRYTVLCHGVGLCDEYPTLVYAEDLESLGDDGRLESSMVVSVETYVGRVGGHEGVKLEEQLLITETGVEPLSTYPFEETWL